MAPYMGPLMGERTGARNAAKETTSVPSISLTPTRAALLGITAPYSSGFPRKKQVLGRMSVLSSQFRTQNHPNPFNATTEIAYDLTGTSNVILTLYNITGQQMITLISERQPHYTAAKPAVPEPKFELPSTGEPTKQFLLKCLGNTWQLLQPTTMA